MEQSQMSIQELRQEIRNKEQLLEEMEVEQIKKDLTDVDLGIECKSISREGMSHFFGKHVNRHSRTSIEQQMVISLDVAVENESMHSITVDVDLTVTLCDDGDLYETEISIAPRDDTVNHDCEWLYLPHLTDCELEDEYADELKELDEELVEKFDVFAPAVKKVMDFLRAKRKVLNFVF